MQRPAIFPTPQSAGPGIAPARSSQVAESVDLLPSLLDLLDLQVNLPYPLEGQSLFSETSDLPARELEQLRALGYVN